MRFNSGDCRIRRAPGAGEYPITVSRGMAAKIGKTRAKSALNICSPVTTSQVGWLNIVIKKSQAIIA
jgi:hypothetical protein